MAVTDLSEQLPWWATGYAARPGDPTPPGYNPGAAGSWLNYLASMFNPVGTAQAGEIDPRAAALAQLKAGGSPVPGALSGGGPPVPPDPTGSSVTMNSPGPTGNPTTQPQGGPSFLPQARGAAVPPGPMASGDTILPQGAARGVQPYGPPSPAAQRSPANPLASSGAANAGAPFSANDRFGTFSYQNPNSVRNAPIYTALNLGSLFGGGGPPRQGNMGGNVANTPAPNAQNVSGALGGRSRAPWAVGPLQKGMVWPSDMGPFTPDQIAGRSLRQRYG